MHPISDMKLNVIDSCICDEYPKAYEDITAGEFLDERLVELGLLKNNGFKRPITKIIS